MTQARTESSNAQPRAATQVPKRVFDVVGSSAGLILLSPVFLAIAAAIKADSAGPVFFRQERVGRGGQSFQIVKFRSMVPAASSVGGVLTTRNDNRITRVGAFIRRWKLDELPQLFNVLRGEMSLVGPRPEIRALLELYTPEQRAVMLSVRPGMTDYAAILFRDESALLDGKDDAFEVYRREIMPRKIACYERYARELSIIDDLRIILATIVVLALGRLPKSLGIETEISS